MERNYDKLNHMKWLIDNEYELYLYDIKDGKLYFSVNYNKLLLIL